MRNFLIAICLLYSSQAFSFSYQLRPAHKEDMAALYNLICELADFEGKDLSSLPVTRGHLEEFGFGQMPCFSAELVEVEGRIIGYGLYFFGFSGWQGYPILCIDDLYVCPEYRGKGIGTALLRKLASYGQQHHCCRLEWHVFDWNDAAISFYQKIGGDLRKDLFLVRLEREAMGHLAHAEE